MVTGYGGFVAGSVVWQARGNWDVEALSLIEPPQERPGFRCRKLDLCDEAALDAIFEQVNPDAVIHTAALADIDYCEAHQEEAERVNVGVTRALARLCASRGTKLIFCSTDTVFDGTKGMYAEDDAPRAVNFYASTKIRAESLVRELVPNSVVARLSLVMGLPVLGSGNSFLAKMVSALEAHKPVTFPANEVRTPVDVITLGAAFLELARSDFAGVMHLAGNTRLNRYDMACQIAERLGYSRDLVRACDSNAMAGRAPRPNDASLDNTRARSLLETPMRTLMDGLNLVLEAKEAQSNE